MRQIRTGKSTVESADVMISLMDNDFVRLVDGLLEPAAALKSGKLKLRGNPGVAMKFLALFKDVRLASSKL